IECLSVPSLLCFSITCSFISSHFAEQPQLICSHQPNIAQPGDDVILSCRLDPPISASSETVEWTRPGLNPEYVHVHQDGRLLHQIQNPSYSRRTRLFVDELKHGNVSMKIFKVKLSDEGTYRCLIPSVQKEASVQLLVDEITVATGVPAHWIVLTVITIFILLFLIFACLMKRKQ
uniref:Ig-like domain-containing protein n=1 Tax=Lates calcarifer TaxID=8187 RepID=A0A4W6EF61_LATCA